MFDLDGALEGKWRYATVDEEGQGYPQLMSDGRWYPTVTSLPNGKMLAMSGYKQYPNVNDELQINRVPSLYDPTTMLWSDFPNDAEMPEEFIVDYDPGHHYPGVTYPHGHLIPRGDWAGHIMYSAPQPHAWRFIPDPSMEKNWWSNETPSFDRNYNDSCCTVMLHIGYDNNDVSSRILTIGGFVNGAASNAVEMLSMGADYAEWIALEPLTFARAHANAILLPDGRLLVVGGNTNVQYLDPVLSAEIFDPETGHWTTLPEMQFQRTYHSSAVLLPDGRIWVSGGDFKLPTDTDVRQMNNSEIYTPGYLLEGPRPTIISFDENLGYDHGFNFTTDMIIEKAILIRPGANTHAFDHNQRAVYVEITGYSQSGRDYIYSAIAPHDINVAPPGMYMLFAILPKSASASGETAIPSVAKFVSLS
jgi:hypothetical protein